MVVLLPPASPRQPQSARSASPRAKYHDRTSPPRFAATSLPRTAGAAWPKPDMWEAMPIGRSSTAVGNHRAAIEGPASLYDSLSPSLTSVSSNIADRGSSPGRPATSWSPVSESMASEEQFVSRLQTSPARLSSSPLSSSPRRSLPRAIPSFGLSFGPLAHVPGSEPAVLGTGLQQRQRDAFDKVRDDHRSLQADIETMRQKLHTLERETRSLRSGELHSQSEVDQLLYTMDAATAEVQSMARERQGLEQQRRSLEASRAALEALGGEKEAAIGVLRAELCSMEAAEKMLAQRLAYFEAKAGAEAEGIRLPVEEAEKVDSVIDEVFDGISFDVEMPSQRGGGPHVLLEGEADCG